MKTFTVWTLIFIQSIIGLGAQNPEELPLFDMTQLTYEGAFRLDAGTYGASNLNYSQGPIAYNRQNHSLFIVGHAHQQAIAEFAIPALVKSEELTELNFVETPLQAFVEVLDNTPDTNPEGLNRIGGLYVVNDGGQQKLIVNGYEYYDAPGDNTLTTLIIDNANDLENSSLKGYLNFEGGAGHTSGWISPIPSEWQNMLDGTHITGQSSGIPIISRTSVGPSAFSFQMSAALSADSLIVTTILMDFSLGDPLHADLKNESKENDLWTHLSRATYGFIVPGTRTYLTIGSSGGHEGGVCYKCTQDDGNVCGGYCPPLSADEYQYYWLWDMEDLVKVKSGTLASHDVRPYDYGKFSSPFQEGGMRGIGGGSFDPTTGNLYLSIQRGDTEQGTYARPPVVVVYHVNAPVTTGETPVDYDTPEDMDADDSEAMDKDQEEIGIRIFPNPTSDKLTITGLSTESRIWITDAQSKVVKVMYMEEETVDVDLTHFSNGMYFISVQNTLTKELHVEKILKRE